MKEMCIRDREICCGSTLDSRRIQEHKAAVDRRWTLDAVSYTHLDVYKRQQENRSYVLSGQLAFSV